jgi:hypothetical protein
MMPAKYTLTMHDDAEALAKYILTMHDDACSNRGDVSPLPWRASNQ